jgi:protoporphyrinogen oxidase
MSDIAIIGAGPMGLACAYHLLKQGHRVEVFEADDRVGGMSAHFDFAGMSIERYYHFVCGSDQPLFDMLEELNIGHLMQWRDTKMGYYHEGTLHAWGDPVALLRFSGLGLISKLRYGLHMFYSTRRRHWQDLDGLEASQWIRRWIGDRAYAVLWQPLFEKKFYQYKDNLSAVTSLRAGRQYHAATVRAKLHSRPAGALSASLSPSAQYRRGLRAVQTTSSGYREFLAQRQRQQDGHPRHY